MDREDQQRQRDPQQPVTIYTAIVEQISLTVIDKEIIFVFTLPGEILGWREATLEVVRRAAKEVACAAALLFGLN